MTPATVISALGLVGIGGIAGGYVTYLLDKKKERAFKVLEQKEKRYKSCLLYMDALFEPKNIKYLSSRHADINNAHDIIEYLKMEFHEMILYASKDVILSVKAFIENPIRQNFLRTILTMRRDLSANKNDLDLDGIILQL
jgi:flavorubredoxin